MFEVHLWLLGFLIMISVAIHDLEPPPLQICSLASCHLYTCSRNWFSPFLTTFGDDSLYKWIIFYTTWYYYHFSSIQAPTTHPCTEEYLKQTPCRMPKERLGSSSPPVKPAWKTMPDITQVAGSRWDLNKFKKIHIFTVGGPLVIPSFSYATANITFPLMVSGTKQHVRISDITRDSWIVWVTHTIQTRG